MAKGKLGRGLDFLLAKEDLQRPDDREAVLQLRASDIHPNKRQPREHFDDESLRELMDSIAANIILRWAVRRSSTTKICSLRFCCKWAESLMLRVVKKEIRPMVPRARAMVRPSRTIFFAIDNFMENSTVRFLAAKARLLLEMI